MESESPENHRHIRAELGQALRALGLDDSNGTPSDHPSASEPLPSGTAIGRFMVIEQIGRGGQGEVYAVYDPELDRKVALKRIRSGHASGTQHARLMREAQALARLEHPNVIRVHDTGTYAGSPFLVMEYKPSQSLTHWLAAERRTWREILTKFAAAGRGLQAAHAVDIIHRDVKADNIFIDDHVGAVLGDFGLAYVLDEDPSTDSNASTALEPCHHPALIDPITESGHFPGTEGYIAPEALFGRATRRSDQYSFCVALFQALFGLLARPEERRTPQRPGDEPPPALTRALHRGLSCDATARFPDIAALLEALEVRPRRPIAVIVAATVLLLGGALLAWTYAPDLCRIAAQTSAESVWNPDRRVAVAVAFAAVDLPYAYQTGQSFLHFADEYRDRWVEARAATCEASLPAVEACLDHQRERFDRLLTDYAAPDRSRVQHALDAATHLAPPAQCLEASRSTQADTPEDLRRALDRAELQIAGGDFDGAAHTVADLRQPSARSGHPRVLWLAGWLAGTTAPDRSSDALLDEAMHAAARARDHDTFARAATYRLKSLVLDLGEPAEAATLERWVESFAAQWTRDTVLDQWFRAEFAEARGMRLDATDEHAAAAAQHRRALDQRTALDGRDHPRVAKSHHNLAVSLAYAGDAHDEARAHYAEALRIRREQLGDLHPQTLETSFGMAQAECEYFEPYAFDDPAVLADCIDDLTATLDDYSRSAVLDPRGLHRRAVALAYHAIAGERLERAETALAVARRSLLGLADVDLHERSDLLAVQAKLDIERDDLPAALAALTAGTALWEAARRHNEVYFQLLDGAVLVAVTLQRDEAATALLLDRSAAISHEDCSIRQRHVRQLVDLAELLGPARHAADLQRTADTLRHCPLISP